ncbi:uracil-DNA glycosylase family protein [Sphingobium sp.]|uniref:uracil-DNA glycosylase family protein n=1 Tax=Sphingobium sp. TaxID=1912891 RepID=UPI003BB7A5FC
MRGLMQDQATAADAYLAWWALAGVDCAMGEAPVDWLSAAPTVTSSPPPGPSAAPAVIQEKPRTLETFLAWLTGDPAQPERRWTGAPILPVGGQNATLMVVTDLPDPADMTEGRLLADRAGDLFDAMLRAIGLDRSMIHLASLFTARPPGGMVEAADLATVATRMRTHVALARPRRLLILGDRTIRALGGANGGAASEGLHDFNHEGGTVPAVATFHPRLLLTQPAAKAECWRALQSLIEEPRP